ncbi:MAG TPA: Gfo/Idh/MocA family oxidoreductase [Thermoanaerobaculia bacterium]
MARIGIVGTGWGARVQAPTFREAGLDVVAIAGFHRNKTRQIAEELGIRPHDDWRELVAAANVDLVSVTAPPYEHREIALAALEAGKHVLCEKPTTLGPLEAEHLVTAAKRRPQQIAIIDHELRFLPPWREARERIATDVGRIRYAEARYASPTRNDPARTWNWWSDASRGGGIWGAVGSHLVDALRYFGAEIESVQALLHTIVKQRPFGDGMREVTSDDWASVALRLGNGGVASLELCAVSSGPDDPSMLTIHGDRGAMRFIGEEVLLSQGRAPFSPIAGGPLEKRPGNSPGGAYGTGTLHLGRALRAAIDGGDRTALAPAATFEDGLMQQRVLDAARRSSLNGGWAQV